MKIPVAVTQIIDRDTYTVQVHAHPTPELVTRLCHDLDKHAGKRVMVSHLPVDHPEHQRALRELTDVLAETFTWDLTPGQAEQLGGDVYEATILPDQCVHCEKFGVTTVEGNELCHDHARGYDRSTEPVTA